MIKATVQVKVPFHDIDIMEIAWHGHYVKYFEIARCELFEQLDYNHLAMRESGYAWPVIDLHVRYARPSRFNQENRLKVDYVITDAGTGERLTRGHTIQVALDMRTGEMCFVSPDVLLEKIEKAQEAQG